MFTVTGFSRVLSFMGNFDNVKLSKGKVAVTLTETDNKIGGIYLPEDRKKIFSIGTIVGIGQDNKDRVSELEIGNEVVFQIPAYVAANYGYSINGQDFMILNQGDIIGRLTSGTSISFDTFEPIGEWILCEVVRDQMRGGLFLPEGVGSSIPPTYTLAKKGKYSELDEKIVVGTELMVDRARATPIHFDRQFGRKGEYAYLSPSNVYAFVS